MTKEQVFKSLINNDYDSFRELLNEKISDAIEEKVWNYYHSIEDELNKKMSKSKNSSIEE